MTLAEGPVFVDRSIKDVLPSRVQSRQKERTLVVASLFSGIGGFELGLRRAGHATRMMCEIDPAARSVLERRFEGVQIENDVRLLETIPRGCDLLTAGFPCQNLSQAGDVEGIFGPKSGLVWDAIKLLKKTPTPWVVLENVPFMLSLDGGKAIESLVTALEKIGYKWAYRIVDGQAFGTPQRRRRVFIVASLTEDPRRVLLADNVTTRVQGAASTESSYGFYWTEGNTGLGLTIDAIPPLKPGSTIGIPAAPAVLLPDGNVVVPTIDDAEKLQGFPRGWTSPAIARKARLGPRWRLVGNSVNVKVAAWIGRRLIDPRNYEAKSDRLLVAGKPWPKAAYNVGKGRFRSTVGDHPVCYACEPIGEFLSSDANHLSNRATEGIKKRLLASRLKYPEGFIEKLEKHLARARKRAVQP